MISVITPVYNGSRFIESCVQTVIAQGCPDLEHIIIDGNSTDKTGEIIKHYGERYSHVRWLSEPDRGQSDAMNKGIAMAQGETIAILNVDDFYEPNVLNRVAEIFKELPEPSFVTGNCNVWDNEGNLIKVNKPVKLKLSNLLLGFDVNPFPINPSAYFYHKSLHDKIGLYDIHEDYVMDVDFLFRAVEGAAVTYVDEIWGNYRMLEGTKTVNSINSGKNTPRVERLIKLYRKKFILSTRISLAVQYVFHKYARKITRKLEKIVKGLFTKNWSQ